MDVTSVDEKMACLSETVGSEYGASRIGSSDASIKAYSIGRERRPTRIKKKKKNRRERGAKSITP